MHKIGLFSNDFFFKALDSRTKTNFFWAHFVENLNFILNCCINIEDFNNAFFTACIYFKTALCRGS